MSQNKALIGGSYKNLFDSPFEVFDGIDQHVLGGRAPEPEDVVALRHIREEGHGATLFLFLGFLFLLLLLHAKHSVAVGGILIAMRCEDTRFDGNS